MPSSASRYAPHSAMPNVTADALKILTKESSHPEHITEDDPERKSRVPEET